MLLTKVYNLWAKKVQRSYLPWHWRVIQDLEENWLLEFGKFSPEHSNVSKLGLWWDPFIQNRKCMNLKFTVELCVLTMKNDGKLEKELTCQLKVDMRDLLNFDPSTQKISKIFTLMGCFWAKYIMFELKKVQRSYVWRHWRVMEFLKASWLVFPKITWESW